MSDISTFFKRYSSKYTYQRKYTIEKSHVFVQRASKCQGLWCESTETPTHHLVLFQGQDCFIVQANCMIKTPWHAGLEPLCFPLSWTTEELVYLSEQSSCPSSCHHAYHLGFVLAQRVEWDASACWCWNGREQQHGKCSYRSFPGRVSEQLGHKTSIASNRTIPPPNIFVITYV